jgi:hypothetical protein
MGILQAIQSMGFSPAAFKQPVKQGLHTKWLQGERSAALERIRLHAAQ